MNHDKLVKDHRPVFTVYAVLEESGVLTVLTDFTVSANFAVLEESGGSLF
jgi:hypothetical protein